MSHDLDLYRSTQVDVSEQESQLTDKHNVVNYDIKPVHVKCYDVMKSGFWYIDKLAKQFAISKICVDSIPEKDFIDFTDKFKHQVQFVDPRNPGSEAKDLNDLHYHEIADLIKGHE